MRKTLGLMMVAGSLSLASSAEAAVFLSKPEAKTQAGGFARAFCEDLKGCRGASIQDSYDCKRLSAVQVECDAYLDFDDLICTQRIRVTERSRYYNRRAVFSPDCE